MARGGFIAALASLVLLVALSAVLGIVFLITEWRNRVRAMSAQWP